MDFKTTDSLFAKIKENLYSFDAAGLIDEGKFNKDVQYILNVLGCMWYKDGEEMLKVSNYNTCLPEGFTELEALYKCDLCGISDIEQPDGIVFSKLTFSHYPETQIPDPHAPQACPVSYWDSDPTNIFNVHEQLLIQRGTQTHRYSPPTLMKIGNVNTKRTCSKKCPNHYSQAQDTFTIQNGKIYTNFKEGELLIYYKAFPLDDDTGLPMIPDNVIIEKAIEDYIMYNTLKFLRVNGDASVSQLLPLFQQDADKSMEKAIYLTKLPSFQTMVHSVRLMKKKLNIYQFPHVR